jgi:signal peptidase II
LFCIVSVFFLAIDLVSKAFAVQMLQKPIIFYQNIFSFSLTFNTGIAFSLPVPNLAQITLSILIFVWFVWYLYKYPLQNGWEFFGSTLILGGALGNFLERLLVGSVTDFIAIWKFPVFNFADVFLFLGACFWAISLFFFHSTPSSSKTSYT